MIKDYEGIIGAICGTVFTLFSQYILKNIGKIYFYINHYDIKEFEQNEYGETTYKNVNSFDVKNLRIIIDLELYNSSEIPKTMKNILICIYDKQKSVFKITPYDNKNNDNKNITSNYTVSKEVNVLNLEPKKCISKQFWFTVTDSNIIRTFKEFNKIYLTYNNEKNKHKKILINEEILHEM